MSDDRDRLVALITEASCQSDFYCEAAADAVLAAGWGPRTETQPGLRMVRGGVYRNKVGAVMTARERLLEYGPVQWLGPVQLPRWGVFGEIWIIESADDGFGRTEHLATAGGLADCGYTLVSDPSLCDGCGCTDIRCRTSSGIQCSPECDHGDIPRGDATNQ